MTTLSRRAAERAQRYLAALSRHVVWRSAASNWMRPWLNAYYRRLSASERSQFQKRYAKLFRRSPTRAASGQWINIFLGKRFCMPLTSDEFMLDWDSAVSILGHDIEVKVTYAALIASAQKPEVFMDVGANYGTHSLLFLLNNIQTITFEPNQSCHGYFLRLCAMNNVIPDLRTVAVGDQRGQMELVYPRLDTWLGSVVPKVVQTLAERPELIVQKVSQHVLDDYLPLAEGKRTLIKIDTEGHECAVLRGAAGILRRVKPLVIFEAVRADQRREVYCELESQEYAVYGLPWQPTSSAQPLTLSGMLAHPATNFIGVPRGGCP